jgi:hypothetical protein
VILEAELDDELDRRSGLEFAIGSATTAFANGSPDDMPGDAASRR